MSATQDYSKMTSDDDFDILAETGGGYTGQQVLQFLVVMMRFQSISTAKS